MSGRPLTLCAVSSSRADYGLLLEPLRAIRADPDFRLRLVVTGQHLVKSAGDTAARIRSDGFEIATEIDMGLAADDSGSLATAGAQALAGLGRFLATGRPDLLLLLGDRYEIACCALAATIARVPIAHVAGGDVTEGAFDDAFRHAISKMAHLHFPTNQEAARRIRQLGESDERIHVCGSPGLDLIAKTPIPPRDVFFAAVDIQPRRRNFVVTFHPVTLHDNSLNELEETLAALEGIDDSTVLFTGANADPDGRKIEARIQAFVASHPAARLIPTLGEATYFAALTHMDAVIGNSSSGLYEAPSFGIPTVNIGDRQKGRLRATSVIDCPPQRDAIRTAVDAALARGKRKTVNPYGDGHASERIIAALKSIGDPKLLLRKRFVDRRTA